MRGTATTNMNLRKMAVLCTVGVLSLVNKRVPHDLAIVGFDDIPEASYFQPPLTTVHQPVRELGVHALKLLIQLINEEAESTQSAAIEPALLLPELVIRRSSV